MDRNNLTRMDILNKIQRQEITAEKGLQLLRAHKKTSTSSTIKTYNFQWERKDLISLGKKDASQCILLLDHSEEVRRIMVTQQGLDPSNIVLVLPGKAYKKMDYHTYSINPNHKEDYKKLFQELKKENKLPSKILHRFAKEPWQENEIRARKQMEEGFYTLLHLSQTIMEIPMINRIELLYVYVNTGGLEPLHAAISGFAKTIGLENPYYHYRTIGVSPEDASDIHKMTHRMLQELESQEKDTEIRYEKGVRLVRTQQEIHLKDSNKPLAFRKNGTYLITGGCGGIGMIFARYLALHYQANLILTGSSNLNKSKERAIERLGKLGGKVVYIKADLSLKEDTQKLVDNIHSHYGNVQGVLHCAGYIKDALLVNKEEKDIERVFGPKIYGSIFLSKILEKNTIDFMVFFSGLASVKGNVGQVDYSYANAFLDYYAKFLGDKFSHTKILSINWPLWQNGGMQIDEDIKRHLMETSGLVPISDQEGIKIVEEGLKSSSYSQIIVLTMDRRRNNRTMESSTEKMVSKDTLNRDLEMPEEDLNKTIESYLKKVLSDQLKLNPSQIMTSEPWEKYGIDSMSIVRMTNKIEKDLGELSKTLFFEYQSLEELTRYFVQNHKDKFMVKLGNKKKSLPQSSKVKTIPPKPPKSKTLTSSPVKDGIAIIGMSGRYPQAKNLEEYWENLKEGKDCITEIPSNRWDYRPYYSSKRGEKGKIYSKWGGFIEDHDKFDPLFFGITPRDAEVMDPQERLFLEVTWQAIEDAGYNINQLNKYEVGVYVGVMYGHYQLFGAEESVGGNIMALSSSYSSIANRISYVLDLKGPSIALDTMCSSSLTTIHMACESIRSGECDMAVAGGVNLSIHPTKYLYLCANNFASSDGRCRSFGEGGDGYVPGEGVGAIILKSLSQAEADGDPIYGVIKGSAVNHDGKTHGYTVPNPNSQSELIVKALKKAKIHPRAVSYIEAHGTGTSLGDPIEITGLTKAFNQYTKDQQYCSIGSVKSNIGHLEATAGIAGITKILLQMKHRQLVPSIHSDTLNPNIKIEDTPFYVQRRCTSWNQPVVNIDGRNRRFPRIAGISGFGAGGSNAHIIIEEYVDRPLARLSTREEPRLVILSARNQERLKEYANALLTYIKRDKQVTNNKFTNNSSDMLPLIQKELHELVADILEVNVEELDMDGSLLDVNLDMVALSRIIEQINNIYNAELTLEHVLNNPSVDFIASTLCNVYGKTTKEKLTVTALEESTIESTLHLDEIAYTLQMGREEKEERLVLIVSNIEELQFTLEEYLQGNGNPIKVYNGRLNKNKPLAYEKLSSIETQDILRKQNYSQLAKLWIEGRKIDWNLLYDYSPRRVSLPTYPFERKTFWYNSYQKVKDNRKIQKVSQEVRDIEMPYKGTEVSLQIIEESIAVITMQDRENRNMFSENLVRGLMAKVEEVKKNKQVKAIILTGYDNIFSMGGMQQQLLEIANQEREFTDVPFLYRGLLECPIPVISAIQGHASGGGLLFGLYGDIIIMAEEGIYSAVFTKYGFTPGMGATYILKEKFGHNLALEMMYTAKSFTGEELSKKGGLVTFKPREEVMEEALRIGRMLRDKPLITLQTLKKELSRRMLEELPKYIEDEKIMHHQTFTKPEVKERIQHYYLNDQKYGEQPSLDNHSDNSRRNNQIQLMDRSGEDNPYIVRHEPMWKQKTAISKDVMTEKPKIKLKSLDKTQSMQDNGHTLNQNKEVTHDLESMLEAIESGKLSPEEALRLRQSM